MNQTNKEEQQYLNLIRQILDPTIPLEESRNGKTKSIFGSMMRFSLANNKIPILTTKQTAWRTCLKELLWFIRGQTNNKILQKEGVHIWNANSSTEFLETRGLSHYNEGELGPIYGFQWRNFNGNWFDTQFQNESETPPLKTGIDQLQQIIDQLKNKETRNSRRLIMSAWNPCQLDQMALPPCHIMCQFNVTDTNKLSCLMYQRSGDVGLGVPFNIASYSFLTHILAKHCDLIAHEFVYVLGNAHIYESHIEALTKQIKREPREFPTIEILQTHDNINDYEWTDIKIQNYNFHGKIEMKMVA